MKENIAQFFSPYSAFVLSEFERLGSMEALRKAHPEFTDAELNNVTKEILQMTGASPAMKSKGKAKRTREAYQLKITLAGSKPPIWRRVIVPADIKLNVLHDVIQEAMGWTDSHLHLFEIDREFYQARYPDGELEGLDEKRFKLNALVDIPKARFSYVYDFGDSWDHTIVLEKIIPTDQPVSIVCLKGKGRCPPEDCGGIWGYYEKLRILKNPADPEYEETEEWMGDVDSDEFDLDAVNKSLADLNP